jgi:hypothetical protein
MRPPALGSGDLRCWNMHEVDCSSHKGRENEGKTHEGLGFYWSWVGTLQLPPLPALFSSLIPCVRLLTISGRPVQALMCSAVNKWPTDAPLDLPLVVNTGLIRA